MDAVSALVYSAIAVGLVMMVWNWVRAWRADKRKPQ
jgi:VIT1/CCC1 family predicted Fe2+/Mn2+ transporter